MSVMRAMVANHFGYSIANIRPVSSHALSGDKLAFVPLSGGLRPMRMGILAMRGLSSPLVVRRFIDFCSEKLRTMSGMQLPIPNARLDEEKGSP
jgi:DNA-binding transcriptional LysR family regulator